jgi:hypothetical protein
MVSCLVITHNIKHVLYRDEIEDCDAGAISYAGLSYTGINTQHDAYEKQYHYHRSPSIDMILNQFHPSPTIANCSLRSILTLPTHLS